MNDQPAPPQLANTPHSSGRPILATITLLLAVAVAVSNAQLSLASIDNLVGLVPLAFASLPPGGNWGEIAERLVRSGMGVGVMWYLALRLVRTGFSLLEQRKRAVLWAIVLAALSPALALPLYNQPITSLAVRWGLSGGLIAFLLLPSNQTYFERY